MSASLQPVRAAAASNQQNGRRHLHCRAAFISSTSWSLFLPLPLSVHVHASLLDHRQTLHSEHVILQQRLFGLQPRRQIENLLGVGRRADASSELLKGIDALRGCVVHRLAHGVLGAGLPGDAVELALVIRIAAVAGIGAILIEILVDRIRKIAAALPRDQTFDVRKLLRQNFRNCGVFKSAPMSLALVRLLKLS